MILIGASIDSRFPLDYFIFKLYLPNDVDFWIYNTFDFFNTPAILYLTLKNKH